MTESKSHSQFRALRWRLLLSFLGVMAAILSVSALTVYELFVKSLYHQLDNRLLTLADTAAQNLSEIEHDPADRTLPTSARKPETESHLAQEDANLQPPDRDADLDIPLQQLPSSQGAEWFDAQGHRIATRGKLLPQDATLNLRHLGHGKTLPAEQIRSLTQTVYAHANEGQTSTLAGYVRVSESIVPLENTLEKLRWGIGLGSILALGLAGVGGTWLTRQALQPIERSFRQLRQFTADASHELRNPLAAIKTSVDVMQSHPERIHPADEKKLAAIASATRQITQLVEDLLLLARMDSDILQLRQMQEAIVLDRLLADLGDSFEILAEEQGVGFVTQLQPDLVVTGDRPDLIRLFNNLLQNALQYTPKGGKIALKLGQREGAALVTVEDTGIGIAPADLPLVFDRFWRADKARSHRQGGMGMGLAIAQSIAQAHGGEISVSSQPSKGSSFTVRLPLRL